MGRGWAAQYCKARPSVAEDLDKALRAIGFCRDRDSNLTVFQIEGILSMASLFQSAAIATLSRSAVATFSPAYRKAHLSWDMTSKRRLSVGAGRD